SISGSGPAYFALVVDALARSGVSVGLSRDVAERLAVQTMRGTAELLGSSHMHPEALVDAVSSPGGTTIAAISKLESHGVRAAFADAVRAATWRAEELGSK
ncbi:MAG: pyrroline-5-carboxylate reductase, partial [Coriobacteriia bacterium]|nr:pyrroline-5-carboxylate reductase [Coriobacteriia bacterium]